MEITNTHRVKMCMMKMKPQFPETPGGQLMCAVFEQAIKDLVYIPTPDISEAARLQSEIRNRSARRYLRGKMTNLTLLNIDPEWVRGLLVKYGLVI